MVKVVGLSEEEIKQQKRISKLEGIAKEVFPNVRVESNGLGISVTKEGSLMLLYGLLRSIDQFMHVYTPEVFEGAVKLAEAYEKVGEPEITIKKEYRE
jgi:hypothetical protein